MDAFIFKKKDITHHCMFQSLSSQFFSTLYDGGNIINLLGAMCMLCETSIAAAVVAAPMSLNDDTRYCMYKISLFTDK